MAYRARSVLSIRPFRRLWGVTYLCSMGDWLALLALSGLASQFTQGYKAQSFAFAGVVLTQLLPGLLFAPLGGLFADRFDRRKVMAFADVGRFGLLLSIALVGSPLWLFIGNFLVGCCALLWIPSKDAAVPNLLRRPDQVETANQLGLVMTYGISVISGAGLYALINGVSTNLNLRFDSTGLGIVKVILILTALFYLTSALLIATRIPELSRRVVAKPVERAAEETAPEVKSGFLAMVRDAGRFVRTTPLVRGLLIGMVGAFAAAGALVGSAQLYGASLGGGESTFGLLFVALFVGLVLGMTGSPKLARRLPRNRMFGIAIVVAGLAQVLLAISPHPVVTLPFVVLLGACAGAAFLTGVTIIGTEVEDAIRGRINAIYQSMMKIILASSMAVTPLLVGLVQPHTITVFGREMVVDGTRPVLLGAGIIAALVGVIAYRQMDDRRSESILSDLLSAVRGKPRRSTGLLIAVEGNTHFDTSTQAHRLADWLRAPGRKEVLLATDPVLDDAKLRAVLSGAQLSSARAHALVAAAVRADLVEREIRPALDRGALVVMERFVDSPLAHLSAAADLDSAELEGLADWATSRLRPDITILLDRDPATLPPRPGSVEHHWHVRGVLTDMAAADPDRYVVVDGDGPADEVAARVAAAVYVALVTRNVPGFAEDEPVKTPVDAG
ncbi:MFS transporter [Actinokineospora sp. PR83]|uniref:bifunctional MFS transporter/dTMP kinase n=1 Tax=Actinokineospora sp. PR83 TaxID=2884908 RepID=UPI001F3536EB|nr:dTMP kinase [Actinokineospora sp. PR83]MCG8919854.1 MFS transporter [Actinokineospora sp. PR83]